MRLVEKLCSGGPDYEPAYEARVEGEAFIYADGSRNVSYRVWSAVANATQFISRPLQQLAYSTTRQYFD